MTRWTHNGEPIGQPQRPWRLTRAQRVEMEAALARLRGDVRPFFGVTGCDARLTVQGSVPLKAASHLYAMHRRNEGTAREWRILRARVAIALRAALRADEDARCEEALRDHDRRVTRVTDPVWRTGADVASWAMVDRFREWPRRPWDPVPLALWEIDERRRRETVRAVVALLTWGLS